MIDEAAQRGAELTQHLLAFARKQPLQPRETDINALIVETPQNCCGRRSARSIEIESMLEDDVWPALVDPNQLTTALLNLAVNARDAMPNGGKLTLETRNVHLDESLCQRHMATCAPGPYVMIAVSDTGSGIPAALRDKVFEPFFTTKEIGKGTGLGLSMVYGFVKQSGGHIKIYSEEGHGTTVKLYLPRATGARRHARRSRRRRRSRAAARPSWSSRTTRWCANTWSAQLRSFGYATLAAANAAEALAIVDGGAAFDLLFTDVIMPGAMNGRQLADEVEETPARPQGTVHVRLH